MKKSGEFILWFSDINMSSLPRVGGKAASLGEMFNLKFPIPNGFCITADAYRFFLEETNIKAKIAKLLKNLDVEDTNTVEEAANKIQELIIEQEIPVRIKNSILESYEMMNVDPKLANAGESALSLIKAGRDLPYVAVRSSATAEDLPQASFAGQQATFLNVRGNNNVLQSVKKCWASLFTARAIYYREKNNFPHEQVLIAVVVQRMVNSEKSGIMFTANPATSDVSEIVIEAVYGLGETIVSGSVNPNQFIVDKATLGVKKKEIREQEWGLFRAADGSNMKRDISKKDQVL